MMINSSGEGIVGTIDASYYKGQGEREGIEREYIVMGEVRNTAYDAYQHHGWRESSTIGTLTRDQNCGIRGDTPLITRNWCIGNGQTQQIRLQENVGALNCMHDQQAIIKGGEEMETIVRRLTPTECERLQAFPDGWTDITEGYTEKGEPYWTDDDGKRHKVSDSGRYKAIGNSIATPFWFWLLRRISAQYERPATLGSLFDGIGGFPLCWERCNGKGTAIWASEVEPFCIAVTKKHFGEEGEQT